LGALGPGPPGPLDKTALPLYMAMSPLSAWQPHDCVKSWLVNGAGMQSLYNYAVRKLKSSKFGTRSA